jgi:hypothetical protein
MASTRLTIIFALPQVPGPQAMQIGTESSPRGHFWANLTAAIQRKTGAAPFTSPDRYEDALYRRFGEWLKERLRQRISSRPEDWENLHFKVVQLRYGSALIDLDIYGLGAVLNAAGVNEEFFVEMLELYSPDALIESAYGTNAGSAGTGLGASVQLREHGDGLNLKSSRLLNAMNASLLAPVILALLVCYMAFFEMHDEKVRYLDQNKTLMDHYQSEIDSLRNRQHFEENRSGEGTPASHPGGAGEATPVHEAPVVPEAPHTGVWIFAGDVLLVGGLAALFLWGKKTWGTIAGSLMLLAGGGAHGIAHFEIKSFEIKLDHLFSPPGKREVALGPIASPTPTARIALVGPELLMDIPGFESGKTDVPKEISPRDFERQVCTKWKSHNRQGEDMGLVLVLGGTDTTRLTGVRSIRYESNFGLAQARAEEVKARIVGCGIDRKHVLAMVFGPQHTPDLAGKRPPKEGNAEDRRVQVWGLWAWPGT